MYRKYNKYKKSKKKTNTSIKIQTYNTITNKNTNRQIS